jgi:hypothetical protein
MVEDTHNVQQHNEKQEVEHGSQPERSDPDKEVAWGAAVEPVKERAYKKGKGEKKKKGQVINPPGRVRRQGLPSPHADVEVYTAVYPEKDEIEGNVLDDFHFRYGLKSSFQADFHKDKFIGLIKASVF